MEYDESESFPGESEGHSGKGGEAMMESGSEERGKDECGMTGKPQEYSKED